MEANTEFTGLLEHQNRIINGLEAKVETLINENERLNGVFMEKTNVSTEKLGELTRMNSSLNTYKLQLTELLTEKMKKEQETDVILMDFEQKIEVLLQENGKLHAVFEEKIRNFEGMKTFEERIKLLQDEKSKLNAMLSQKNEAELYWRKKFEEIEGKIKILFFQTNQNGY